MIQRIIMTVAAGIIVTASYKTGLWLGLDPVQAAAGAVVTTLVPLLHREE